MASLGQILKEAREAKGLSPEEVEVSTKIRKRYLLALEMEDFARLPHPTYVKGFLQTYASFLGLDPREVLALYPHREQPLSMPPGPRLEKPRKGAGFWIALLGLLALLSGVAVYFYYYASVFRMSPQSAPVAGEELGAPTVFPTTTRIPLMAVPTPTPAPTPTPQVVEVRARVLDRTWVWVIVDSRPVFTGTLEPGQDRTWTGREKVFIRTGNAGGLHITHNGLDRGVLGARGAVLNVEWTRESMSYLSNPPR